MADFSPNRVALFALFCLVSFSGCKDPEKEKALADAEAAKTALAKVRTELETVKATLDATQKERDSFKTKVGDLSASLENLKTQLTAVTKVRDKLQTAAEQVTTLKDQLTQLSLNKDAALAKAASAQSMADKLQKELQDQIQKAMSLQDQNNKLQQAVEELKKLSSTIKIPGLNPPQ